MSPSFVLFKRIGIYDIANKFGLSSKDIDLIEKHFLSEKRFNYVEFKNGGLIFNSIDVPTIEFSTNFELVKQDLEDIFIEQYYRGN